MSFIAAEPAAATTWDESAINSDNVRHEEDQEEQAAEHKTSQIINGGIPTPSDHHPAAALDTIDTTTSDDDFNEVQKVAKPTEATVDKDVEDDQEKVVTESVTDEDTQDSHDKTQLELTVVEDSEEDQNTPKTEADLDKDTGDDANEVAAASPKDEDTENDGSEVVISNQVNEDVSTPKAADVGETADSAEMETNGSGGDEMSDEPFLSPAASEPDIIESVSPTNEQPTVANSTGGSVPWAAEVPILETDPPAMDSDYEEAPLCEMDEGPSTLEIDRENIGDLKDKVSDAVENGDSNTSNQTSAAAATAVKPKPM